jgi:peptidoglycan/LPS O-acetylase OafA/YrhL
MSSFPATKSRMQSSSEPRPATRNRERLVWLDILRFLCALMIVSFHWLRSCFQLELFGSRNSASLIVGYQGQSIGMKMLPHVLIAGSGRSPSVWLTNLVGLLGAFGWEGVSALIIVSGFSLTIALNAKRQATSGWLSWFKKRAVRILVPFYLVAIPFLVTYLALLVTASHVHGSLARSIDLKLHTVLQTPLLGVVLSHTLLVDPFARQWQPQFFAPAWWFIPAILIAYIVYPLILGGVRRLPPATMLGVGAVITITSYYLADLHVLLNESSYFIVLQEAFNLILGVVLGHAWISRAARMKIESTLFSNRAFIVALALFVVGNLANWSPSTRPFASMMFGPGLTAILVFIAKRLESTPVARLSSSVDAYDLYLVHQPFAFPVALAAKAGFHSYAVFLGWFVFVGVASAATFALAFIQRIVFRRTAA